MHKFVLALVAFTLLPKHAFAQENRKLLKGKVTSYANNLSGIYVINSASEQTTMTEQNGYFQIDAKIGDTLMFSSLQFKGVKLAINSAALTNNVLLVKMEPLMHQLNEVQVFQYKGIDAVSLGIITKGQKKYSPAERKFRTATNYNAKLGFQTSATLDPVFNLLSGRTAELRKNIEVEKKEHLLLRIESMYDHDFFVEKLKIASADVKGFQYYIIENPRFAAAVNAHNNSMATFLLGDLAVKYLQILADEKQ